VVETNVHFPTDINLLWDSGRKCLDTLGHIKKELGGLSSWRQSEDWRIKLKKHYRKTSEIHRKKGSNYKERLKSSTKEYLTICRKLSSKIDYTLKDKKLNHTTRSSLLLIILEDYKQLLDKHIDLVYRRIIKGEKIPHNEKLFSIFEPYTEWLNKGKVYKNVELGLNIQVATDQYHFIVCHHVMQHEVDSQMVIPMSDYIVEHFNEQDYKYKTISFDKNYFSYNAKQMLEKLFDKVIMPKPGKKSKALEIEESSKTFVALRQKHSLIESNINQLEHHGLNKCPDKGIHGFKRYVSLGIIAYNLHRLGNILKKI